MLLVHVRPGASRSGLTGLHAGRLCARVRARPVEGAANRALLQMLAQVLGVPPSALSVEGGAAGRDKRVLVRGLTADVVRERLAPRLCVDKAEGGD